jgi:hypothetical protein
VTELIVLLSMILLAFIVLCVLVIVTARKADRERGNTPTQSLEALKRMHENVVIESTTAYPAPRWEQDMVVPGDDDSVFERYFAEDEEKEA